MSKSFVRFSNNGIIDSFADSFLSCVNLVNVLTLSEVKKKKIYTSITFVFLWNLYLVTPIFLTPHIWIQFKGTLGL